jgi:MoaA/NifB/PqqE/SkfB family radical SAM enzyme
MSTVENLGFPDDKTFLFPNIINVEVYRGGCPCQCRHCPLGRIAPGLRRQTLGFQAMSLEIFEQIAAEVSLYPHAMLRIHAVGEPLLWTDLKQAVTLAHSLSVKTWLFTSAVTKKQSLLETIAYNCSIIEVSVNSTNAADYAQTKGIDAFALVEQNIVFLWDYIHKNMLSTRLVVSRVQENQKTDEDFIRYWRDRSCVHDAFVRSYHSYNNLISDLHGETTEQSHRPCLVHWARFNISTNGYAVVCFNELFRSSIEPDLVLGKVSKQSIADIWHGPKLNAIRKSELSGDYSELSFANVLPCKDCVFCQPLNGSNQTSEFQVEKLGC